MDPVNQDNKDLKGNCCEPGQGCECEHEQPHHDHGHHNKPDHGPKRDFPPHLMREIMDMKEKIGKLEGMMEVILKKID
jgi:hypothetical protein